jgi:membrane-associated phospholipid phosphatase
VTIEGVGERVAWAAGILLFWAAGYFGLGRTQDPLAARHPATMFDERIPFVAWTVWPYLSGLLLALLPLVVVRPLSAFRRTSVAYLAVLAAAFGCFAFVPATSLRLRPDAPQFAAETLSHLAVRALYAADPPVNLFPSLHIALGALAAGAVPMRFAAVRRLGFVWLAIVAVSACTVKQHVVLDIAGGLVLAAAGRRMIERPLAAGPPALAESRGGARRS